MHLIWANLIPNLIRFWTGKFKDLDHDGQDYVIMKTVWEAIGEATFWAGEMIPAVFGSCVPNVALEKAHMICEMLRAIGNANSKELEAKTQR